MQNGHATLALSKGVDGTPRIVLMRLLDSSAHSAMMVAEFKRDFLFSSDLAPTQIDVLVYASDVLLFATVAPELSREVSTHRTASDSSMGHFDWSADDQSYAASFWSIPMTYDFFVPGWTIVTTQAHAEVLAPIRDTRLSFTLIALLSLWIVMLLSSSQVRRYLVPLQMLAENTARVGRGDFDGHLDIRSGDEFEEVAASFNTMSAQLKRHFETLSVRGQLDRAVLSSLQVHEIVGRVLDWLPRLLDCDGFAVIVLDRPPAGQGRAFAKQIRDGVIAPIPELVSITLAHATALTSGEGWIHVTRNDDCPGYLSVLGHVPWTVCVLMPIVSSGQLVGVLAMADTRQEQRSADDLQVARQLADQLGVALSNASLVEALDRLNVGTLTALARTVDAKSPWTAGHSQRVTEYASAIAREMGLAPPDLDRLARGSLLHDIGKIAVPSSILNKPGKLTDAEFALMKQHPTIGARILEPIHDYDSLIPIVLQHHERFDGTGYPAGIAREAISLDARIVAVADVFDALTSERPYRKALDRAVAVQMIVKGKGTEFDPAVVDAFLRIGRITRAA
jgi:putative nucleotidyltransferase with HDIG domain